MADVKSLVLALTPRDIEEILRLGPAGPLTPKLLRAIDRAAGGPGEGRGYYVYGTPVHRDRARPFVLRGDVCAELFGPRR